MGLRQKLGGLTERLRYGLWLVPSGCVLLAVGLSFLALHLDQKMERSDAAFYLFQGGPEAARSVLSTIGSSMMTFTGVVFSVTILVLQLASNQFSPRVLRTFFRDRPNQVVLGIFAGTFVYSLLALRNVRGASEYTNLHVPGLTVWFAVILALVSIGTFVFFLHHIAQSIRAVKVLERIGDETRESLDTLYPEQLGLEAPSGHRARPEQSGARVYCHSGSSGVVVSVDEEALWKQATSADVCIALVPRVGDFVPHGSALFELWGDTSKVDADALCSTVRLASERSLTQDVAFGVRQIVDIAERALSPGINDPTTAVQAIDQIHDLLRRLLARKFPDPFRLDESGRLRLWLPRPDWESYVALAIDEIRQFGAKSVQVQRRLRFLLEDLLSAAPRDRRPALERQLQLLDASVRRSFDDPREVDVALRPSSQGHGPASRLTSH